MITHWDPHAKRWVRKPRPISQRITIIEERDDGYGARFKDLTFLVSEARENDGRWWLHASVSRRDRRMPSYDDLKTLKELTIGPKRTAIQVFPPPGGAAHRHRDEASQTHRGAAHLEPRGGLPARLCQRRKIPLRKTQREGKTAGMTHSHNHRPAAARDRRPQAVVEQREQEPHSRRHIE